jgi:hypothetical protein
MEQLVYGKGKEREQELLKDLYITFSFWVMLTSILRTMVKEAINVSTL